MGRKDERERWEGKMGGGDGREGEVFNSIGSNLTGGRCRIIWSKETVGEILMWF